MALRFSLLLHLLRNPQNSNVEEMFNWVHLFPLCAYREFTFFISDEMQNITKFWNMIDLSGWTQTLRSCVFNIINLRASTQRANKMLSDEISQIASGTVACYVQAVACGFWNILQKNHITVWRLKTVCWTWFNFEWKHALPLPWPTRYYLDEILPPLPT